MKPRKPLIYKHIGSNGLGFTFLPKFWFFQNVFRYRKNRCVTSAKPPRFAEKRYICRQGKRTRPDISDYKEAVAKRDKKLLTFVNSGYNILHLSMGYDGEKSKSVCDEGFRLANAIIDRCAALS